MVANGSQPASGLTQQLVPEMGVKTYPHFKKAQGLLVREELISPRCGRPILCRRFSPFEKNVMTEVLLLLVYVLGKTFNCSSEKQTTQARPFLEGTNSSRDANY